VPAPTLLVPHVDQAIALPVAGAAALLAAALATGSRRLAVTAGLLGGLAVLLSYGAVAFLSIVGLAVVGAAVSEAAALRRAAGLATIAGASAAAVVGATVLLGHSPLQAARVALGIHRDAYTAVRSYPLWLFFNPVDLAIFLGVPVAALAAGRVIAAVRASLEAPADRFAAALAFGLGLLWLSGTTRGEVGRIWIPLMPLLLVSALGHPAEEREAGPSSREATVLGVVLCAWCFALRMSWDL
jgi:methylthioxylose transferase